MVNEWDSELNLNWKGWWWRHAHDVVVCVNVVARLCVYFSVVVVVAGGVW